MKQAIVSFWERPTEATVQEQKAQVINTLADIQLSVSNFMTQIQSVKQHLSKIGTHSVHVGTRKKGQLS